MGTHCDQQHPGEEVWVQVLPLRPPHQLSLSGSFQEQVGLLKQSTLGTFGSLALRLSYQSPLWIPDC